jgi:hypothetical protein
MRSLLSLFVVAVAPVLKDCGNGKSLIKLNSFSLTPTIPVPGDNVFLHIDYTVPEGMIITGGVATYAVTYNFIPIAPTTEPLCGDIPCPLGPGRYVNTSVSQWPTGLRGNLLIKNTWVDELGAPLLCLSITAKM